MAKRKFTRIGEPATSYQCTNRKCKWEGKQDEKIDKRISPIETVHICPQCFNNEFYGIL